MPIGQEICAPCGDLTSAEQLTRQDYQALWNLVDQEVQNEQRRLARVKSWKHRDRANNRILRLGRLAERIAWHINYGSQS